MSNVATSKEKRQQCWDARDAYFACMGKGGGDSCDSLRSGFTEACPASWVKHFEQSQRYERDKAARIAHIESLDAKSK